MFGRARHDDEVRALALGMLRRLVVLVENLADDLLEQILHRHETRRAAVLVEHDRHVLLETLEVGEHLFDLARAGDDVDLARMIARARSRAAASAESECRSLASTIPTMLSIVSS